MRTKTAEERRALTKCLRVEFFVAKKVTTVLPLDGLLFVCLTRRKDGEIKFLDGAGGYEIHLEENIKEGPVKHIIEWLLKAFKERDAKGMDLPRGQTLKQICKSAMPLWRSALIDSFTRTCRARG